MSSRGFNQMGTIPIPNLQVLGFVEKKFGINRLIILTPVIKQYHSSLPPFHGNSIILCYKCILHLKWLRNDSKLPWYFNPRKSWVKINAVIYCCILRLDKVELKHYSKLSCYCLITLRFFVNIKRTLGVFNQIQRW